MEWEVICYLCDVWIFKVIRYVYRKKNLYIYIIKKLNKV